MVPSHVCPCHWRANTRKEVREGGAPAAPWKMAMVTRALFGARPGAPLGAGPAEAASRTGRGWCREGIMGLSIPSS